MLLQFVAFAVVVSLFIGYLVSQRITGPIAAGGWMPIAISFNPLLMR